MDAELKTILKNLSVQIEELKQDFAALKKNQKLTHEHQERLFKNQTDMENKLDQIKKFENYEFEELKEIEFDEEKNQLTNGFEKIQSPFIMTILDNLDKKIINDDTFLTDQHLKVIHYLFSRDLYDASHKKFIGVNFRRIREGAEVNTNQLKDILIKLEEEKYIISEITSEKDKSRKNFIANVNFFKN